MSQFVTTKVANPTTRIINLSAVAPHVLPMATTTGGTEVLIHTTAEAINPAHYSPDIMSNGSSKSSSDSEISLDSEEEIDNYKRQYEEEDGNVFFC